MTRSDGQFPKYVKLTLDPDKWPDNYYEASYKCPGCGKGWPVSAAFNPTPCCGQAVVKLQEPPDMRWPEAISELKEYRFDKFYKMWNEGASDADLFWEEVKTNGEVDERKLEVEVDKLLDDVERGNDADQERAQGEAKSRTER